MIEEIGFGTGNNSFKDVIKSSENTKTEEEKRKDKNKDKQKTEKDNIYKKIAESKEHLKDINAEIIKEKAKRKVAKTTGKIVGGVVVGGVTGVISKNPVTAAGAGLSGKIAGGKAGEDAYDYYDENISKSASLSFFENEKVVIEKQIRELESQIK